MLCRQGACRLYAGVTAANSSSPTTATAAIAATKPATEPATEPTTEPAPEPAGFWSRPPSAPIGGAWRVAIVGSGPAGFYTADALLKGSKDVRVDIFDRLPAPFGLVRYGVAPDHPEVKNVTERFTGIAASPRVRFAGNVRVGDGTASTVTVEELRGHYDALVLACGAEGDRRLNLPGEELRGVSSAREFVAWYNGHPDFARERWDLSRGETAVIVGQGNVALDVARVLAKRASDIAPTDITCAAVAALEASQIRRVFVVGRRGPLQAAFTTKECRELSALEGVRVRVELGEGALDALSESALEALKDDRPRRRAAELLRKLWLANGDGSGVQPLPSGEREVVLAFHLSPLRFEAAPAEGGAAGGAEGGELGCAVFERTRVEGGRAVGTGEHVRLPCGYVFRSVGYVAFALPGVPFDPKLSRVPSAHGRVLHSAEEGALSLPGLYCAGWFKRGPSGVILTNIADAAETASAVLADHAASTLPSPEGSAEGLNCGLDGEGPDSLPALFATRGISPVGFEGWARIDAHERKAGAEAGKRLAKVVALDEMLWLAAQTGSSNELLYELFDYLLPCARGLRKSSPIRYPPPSSPFS
ncbi:hypothetical protein T492DRAFT_596714 [Pavlovales sp. CCMP2436]|nr:hypothetical protein T492DRAFT_596714 [Pavlovales sp. CCMP2436]